MVDFLRQTPDICFPHNEELWTMKLLIYECFLGMLNALEIYLKITKKTMYGENFWNNPSLIYFPHHQ